jgi:hypothetical protein
MAASGHAPVAKPPSIHFQTVRRSRRGRRQHRSCEGATERRARAFVPEPCSRARPFLRPSACLPASCKFQIQSALRTRSVLSLLTLHSMATGPTTVGQSHLRHCARAGLEGFSRFMKKGVGSAVQVTGISAPSAVTLLPPFFVSRLALAHRRETASGTRTGQHLDEAASASAVSCSLSSRTPRAGTRAPA